MKPSPPTTPPEALLDVFEPLEECHRVTLRMLAELSTLVDRVDEVGVDTRARDIAQSVGHYFSVDLPRHHIEEEAHVFPALAGCSDTETVQAIARLKLDHAWLRADWRVLSPFVKALAAGHSWVDVDALRDGVEVFCTLARDHIALEESVVYPQARIHMLESTRRQMRLALAARR